MKVLGVCVTLCILLRPAGSVPLNSTVSAGKYVGLCQYEAAQCSHLPGAFCPQCDATGYFLPQQCSPTGYCWCVNVITGVEIPNTRTGPGVAPVDCGRGQYCPVGWSNYANRCLMFIDTPKMWAEAEIYCQFDGANLASVHSHEENRFIMSLTRADTHDFPQAWIGGVAPVLPGQWLWTDGSTFLYENWVHHHNIDNPNQTCLTMNHGYDFKWIHDSCFELHPFVCARSI